MNERDKVKGMPADLRERTRNTYELVISVKVP